MNNCDQQPAEYIASWLLTSASNTIALILQLIVVLESSFYTLITYDQLTGVLDKQLCWTPQLIKVLPPSIFERLDLPP